MERWRNISADLSYCPLELRVSLGDIASVPDVYIYMYIYSRGFTFWQHLHTYICLSYTLSIRWEPFSPTPLGVVSFEYSGHIIYSRSIICCRVMRGCYSHSLTHRRFVENNAFWLRSSLQYASLPWPGSIKEVDIVIWWMPVSADIADIIRKEHGDREWIYCSASLPSKFEDGGQIGLSLGDTSSIAELPSWASSLTLDEDRIFFEVTYPREGEAFRCDWICCSCS